MHLKHCKSCNFTQIYILWNIENEICKISFKMKWTKVKSLSHVRLFLTPWTVAWQVPHPWDFSGRNTGMSRYFLLQILQANCSILPDGLCIHAHTPTLHTGYSCGHLEWPKRVSAQMVSFWKVPGRKSEAESEELPTPHSPAQLRSSSRFHHHHSRIPVSPPPPPLISWDWSETWGPRSPGKTHLQGSLSSGTDTALEVRDWPAKAWAHSLSIRIPGSSSCLSPDIPVNWGLGVGIPCPPSVPSCPPQLDEVEKCREDGRHVCSSEHLDTPTPCPVQVRRP